jgi:hypothetical protein
MMAIELSDVVKMAEHLTDEDKASLALWLLANIRARELTVTERRAVFDAMTLDLGAVLPGYSDHREDWYDDAG